MENHAVQKPTETLAPVLIQQTAQLLPGQVIGNYRVLSSLGVGGMGEVYLGRDQSLPRYVALKVLPKALAQNAERQARLRHEADVLALLLRHTNIALIYTLERFAQGHCLVLEFVPGPTLEERLRPGPLSLHEALLLFDQFIDALAAAHDKGVIHCDLKPANIKITPSGEIKVLDFGIARIFKDKPAALDLTHNYGPYATTKKETLFSAEGEIIGTVPYMSPEQLRGLKLDPRTDIWAFGCVLYQSLTGKLPFDGPSFVEIAAAILNREPDWQALPPTTPASLRELLRQCLEKAPERRLGTALEVQRRLREIGQHSRRRTKIIRLTPPQPAPRPRRGLVSLLVTLVVLLAALLSWEYVNRWRLIPERRHLAIVPFKQRAGAREDKIFAAGLMKRLSDNLAQVPGLQVIPQTPPPDTDDRRVVAELGATLILRGTLGRTGQQTSIAYTLLNEKARAIKNDAVEHHDPFAALDRLSRQIAQALGLNYPAPPGETTDIALQELYLQALGHLELAREKRDQEAAHEAAQAINLLGLIVTKPEGNQALYHAALARAYFLKYYWTNDSFLLVQAQNACNLAQNLEQQTPEVPVTLGRINLRLGRYTEAASNFQQALQQRSDYVEAALGLADTYTQNNQPVEAEQTYRKALALAPDFWRSYNEFGYFYWTRGRYAEAAEQWRQVIRLAPQRAEGHNNLGNAYLYQGNPAAAVAAYRQSLSLRPTPEGHASLGTALYYQRKYQEAAAEFRQGLAANPDNPTLLGNLGDAYRQLSDREQEVQAYEQALKLWNDQLAAGVAIPPVEVAKLAEILAKRGQAEQALTKIAQALQQDPQNPECRLSAIIIYELTGQRAEALQQVQQAVRNGYPSVLLQFEPVLDGLRTDPQFARNSNNRQ